MLLVLDVFSVCDLRSTGDRCLRPSSSARKVKVGLLRSDEYRQFAYLRTSATVRGEPPLAVMARCAFHAGQCQPAVQPSSLRCGMRCCQARHLRCTCSRQKLTAVIDRAAWTWPRCLSSMLWLWAQGLRSVEACTDLSTGSQRGCKVDRSPADSPGHNCCVEDIRFGKPCRWFAQRGMTGFQTGISDFTCSSRQDRRRRFHTLESTAASDADGSATFVAWLASALTRACSNTGWWHAWQR